MRAKVWNNGETEYREEFRGDMIKIPAKGFIEMDSKDANTFRGQFTPIVRDGHGKDLRPKPLMVEEIDPKALEDQSETFLCQMDGSVWPNQKALDAHILKNFSDQLIEPEAKETLKKAGRNR